MRVTHTWCAPGRADRGAPSLLCRRQLVLGVGYACQVSASWSTRPVGIVAPRYAPAVGGVERYVEQLALGLAARGVPIEIVTTDPTSGHESVEKRGGITVRRFPTLAHDATYYVSPAMTRWLRHEAGRYSLLHAHNLHTLVPLAASWGAGRAHLPLVLTAHYHGIGHTPFRKALHVPYRPLARRLVRAAARVICNSDAEYQLLRRDFGANLRAVVIPEGIDPPWAADEHARGTDAGGTEAADGTAGAADRDPDGSTGRVSILSVGRLEEYKGVQRVVAALPFLPADHRLVVVGSGPARDRIEQTAARLGVSGRVVLLGHVPDHELRAWYGRAAVAVSLSRHESFGLTVLESAAAGAPVVASDIPAHRESMAYAPAGRISLVPLDAEGQTLARAITAARAQGRSTDRSAWRLPTWDTLVDGVLTAYESVLGTSPRV
jgi:glycosyltransferase involved in cell wall biosynthesis